MKNLYSIKPLQLENSSRRNNKFCHTAVGFYEIGSDGFCYAPFVCKYPDYEKAIAAINKDYTDKVLSLLSEKVTSADHAPLPDDVEQMITEIANLASNYAPDVYWECINGHADDIRAHIAALEAKITTLRNAAEIGLTYVLAAQSGLTFTKPRMSSDVEVFNDALKMGGDE